MSTWREKYRQDPDLADSIITALRSDLDKAEVRIKKLEYALERIRDSGYPRSVDNMQQVAQEALE